MFKFLNILLALACLAARLLLVDTVQAPAASNELVSRLLYFYRSLHFHEQKCLKI